MYQWTEQRVEWYQRAVSYSRFDRAVADAVAPWLPPRETVCDLGCGTGYLAMELARRGLLVTACDKNETTMAYLRREAKRRGLLSLSICQKDWNQLPPAARWDNVVMAFAGRLDQHLGDYMALARRRLILVVKADNHSHVQAGGQVVFRRPSAAELETLLKDYPHHSFPLEAEFGQPFRSEGECRDYLAAFGASEEGPESALKRLVRLTGGHYPLYLPNRKKMLVYVVEAQKLS